ncbi:MAG TPA: hypothetical protein DDW27_08555, partial [Bacteroidales bacterium]|nr:hypothetical protein [Bacteroidales bacterium]
SYGQRKNISATTSSYTEVERGPANTRGSYKVIDGSFTGYNMDRYNNRPLYCNHMHAFILTGDRPYIRFMNDPYIYGSLMIGVIRDGKGKWLHHFSERTSMYFPGKMEWHLNDQSMPGLNVVLEAVTMESTPGMSIRMHLEGNNRKDQIVWVFGGASRRPAKKRQNLNWAYDVTIDTTLLTEEFIPEYCSENIISFDGKRFTILPPAYEPEKGFQRHIIAGMCSAKSKMVVADAHLWEDLPKLITSKGAGLPLLCGIIDQTDCKNIYWTVEGNTTNEYLSAGAYTDPVKAFENGIARIRRITSQVVVNTPDETLNAAVASGCIVADARFYPPVYVHGTMAWNLPFPGWRSLFGPISFGWHENIKQEARHYISFQLKESGKKEAMADPKLRYTGQSPSSRFYGRGRIDHRDNGFYNFQSQFFDQLCHGWHYTADRELEEILRPALELHLEWIKDCFDPDGNYVYESYINTWATDSQWYNGGDTVEETAYAYYGHMTAMKMAERSGDIESAERHRKETEKIKKALIDVLWTDRSGHLASYREQGGHRRLHEDTWLPSIFLPVDYNMLTPEQAIQCLYYTEWGLERNKMPFGGERCWSSNWVPSQWSVREVHGGDNYHLALAYYQTGLPDMAWELVKGNYLRSMCHYISPGSLGDYYANDFADIADMFNRVIIEGMFGYSPDYPCGKVGFKPEFPSYWDFASIKTPDFSLSFKIDNLRSIYTLSVSGAAILECKFPVNTSRVNEVLVNGKRAKFDIIPGFGQNYVSIIIEKCNKAEVVIRCRGKIARNVSENMEVNASEKIRLAVPPYKIREFKDPQGIFEEAEIVDGAIEATCARVDGHFLILALAGDEGMENWKIFKINVTDNETRRGILSKKIDRIPPDTRWETVEMKKSFNGDIRDIFKQDYLNPRPNTVSARIGSDGYAAWTFAYWNYFPPEITLENVNKMQNPEGLLETPAGVPFAWNQDTSKNIAFTSLWENWPNSVTVPVNNKGSAIWFLVCGSTNPMQTKIANAQLIIRYADNTIEQVELVPPVNFWALSKWGVADYDYGRDRFCLPEEPPAQVQLGTNCRAMLINHKTKKDIEIRSVRLECLSQEVIIGLMGVTLMK